MGEQLAAGLLINKGYQIIETNWRCKLGEIDLIARMNQTLIFVEVKTRTSVRYGSPAEAVDLRKQVKIRRLAEWYMSEHRDTTKLYARFDVITVQYTAASERPVFEHIEGAF